MSKIAELGDKKSTNIQERFKYLPKILGEYLDELNEAEQNLEIKGKSLENANKENPSWYYYYNQRFVELNTLTKYFEGEIERVRGKLFRSFTENNNRDLSDRAKDKYIDNEQAYLEMNELYLEVKEVRDSFEAVTSAFKDRGYTLTNITKIRVATLENDLL